MPTVSLIIPTHNRPSSFPDAVESARAAGTDVEIIVVDDASSDETAQVCRSLSTVKYVRVERNQGVAGARNIGLLASSSEYISFLDDDDLRLPDTLDRQIKVLERDPSAALIYGQATLGDQHQRASARSYPRECPQGDIFWRLLTRNFIPCGSVVFRRSCILRVGILDKKAAGIDDWDLWVRMSQIYPVLAIATPVTIWRRSTPASRQGTSDAAHLVSLAARKFRQHWMSLPRAADASQKKRQDTWHSFCQNMAEHLLWESTRALRCGQAHQALKNLLTLSRLHPFAIANIVREHIFGASCAKLRDSWDQAISNPTRVENRVRER